MKSILIVNPKGGAGKTTLAINLASALAIASDQEVKLWDLDRQHSALEWLSLRPTDRPVIRALADKPKGESRQKDGPGWLVLDSPAGIHGKLLERVLKIAHKVVVPIQPSVFDMAATGTFIQELLDAKPSRKHQLHVGIVGVRVDPRTRAAATLAEYLQQFDLPVLAWLRDTQVYANAAFNGLSIFDLPASVSGRDTEQWRPILEWILA